LNAKSQVHKLTHQQLHIKFWRIAVAGTLARGIDYDTLLGYPFPIVLYNFIEKDWK
jgi:A/G-specific adenine glycosylase